MFNVQCSMVFAENRVKKLLIRADSILTKRYYKSSQDTNYVVRPEGRLTLKLSANQSGNSLRAKGTQNDVPIKSHLTTRHKTTISIGAAYRGISLSYSINPAKLAGLYKDYDLNINFYSKRFCLNANYQHSSSLSGNIYYGDDTYRMNSGDTEMKVWNITAYYIFNHRRFSIAAPFSQSYIQRRSAGSWLAGISYQGGKVKPTDELKENHPEFRDVRLSIGHIGIGGGYGHNFVFGRKWLLHLSFLPTFVVYNRNNISVDGERLNVGHMRFDMLFNERVALVCNFSPRYFAGINAVANNSFFGTKSIAMHQGKWAAHAYFGMRLWK